MSETVVETVTDWHGVDAPAAMDGVSLHQGCPNCGFESGSETFLEVPAGYYTCQRCFSTWAGSPEDADLVTHLEWSEDADPSDLAPDTEEGDPE